MPTPQPSRLRTRSMAAAIGLSLLMSAPAFAQSTAPTVNPLATQSGHDINVSVQHYDYREPKDLAISIHGPKADAEYTGTFFIGEERHWFGRFNARGTVGNTAYDGWCRPWQLVPSTTSANGYRLTLGTASACSETGDPDWYAEGRVVIGRDLIGRSMSLSPFVGVGLRHLSNGTTGNYDFRTEEYLYLPVGATLRTMAADHVLGLTVEYDHLLRGWQTTRNSLLGGGTVPATSTTPAFTIGDFTDFSFDQRQGWALRASATYAVGRWSIEPYIVKWQVEDSNTVAGSVAYGVGGVVARQTLNAYEPFNTTMEYGVKFGVHFGGR